MLSQASLFARVFQLFLRYIYLLIKQFSILYEESFLQLRPALRVLSYKFDAQHYCTESKGDILQNRIRIILSQSNTREKPYQIEIDNLV